MIVLKYVLDNQGTSQDDIANEMAVDKTAIARSLKSLDALGLLIRQENPDNHRMKKVYATDQALRYKTYFDKIVKHWNEILFAEFTEEEKEFIVGAFARMRQHAIDADIGNEVAKLNNGE